jgi:hypothetical protein
MCFFSTDSNQFKIETVKNIAFEHETSIWNDKGSITKATSQKITKNKDQHDLQSAKMQDILLKLRPNQAKTHKNISESESI